MSEIEMGQPVRVIDSLKPREIRPSYGDPVLKDWLAGRSNEIPKVEYYSLRERILQSLTRTVGLILKSRTPK